MKIGRFVKSSLSEWKGRNSCIIEIRGSTRCCPYLGPSDLFDEEGPSIDENEIIDYIAAHMETYGAIVLAGGEPLLQKDLYPFLKKLKALKVPILLKTDGSCPDALDDLAGACMFDRVCLHTAEQLPEGDPFYRSLDVLIDSDVEFEVRIIAVPGTIDKSLISAVSRKIKGKGTLVIAGLSPMPSDMKPLKNKEVLELVSEAKKYCKKVEIVNL